VLKAEVSGMSHDDIIKWLSVPLIMEDKADVDMAEPGTSYELQNALGLILATEKVADREAKDEEEYEHFVLTHTNGTLDNKTPFQSMWNFCEIPEGGCNAPVANISSDRIYNTISKGGSLWVA
jgi:hypothetical protein